MNIKSRLLVAIFASAQIASSNATTTGAQSPASPTAVEAHDRMVKHLQTQKFAYIYVKMITGNARQSWEQCKIPAANHVLTAKTVTSMDGSGRVTDFKIVSSSGSKQCDEAIRKVVYALKPIPFAGGVTSLKLFWTFMSDGTSNLIDHTDSKEADVYNKANLGMVLGPPITDIGEIGSPSAVAPKKSGRK